MSNQRSQPPALATWLLRRLCSKQDREVLVGDLLERFGEGESVRWFWRQVLMAIWVGAARESRDHWTEIFFSIAGTMFFWFFREPLGEFFLESPALAGLWNWRISLQWPMSMVYDLGFWSVMSALTVQPILAAVLLLNGEFRWVSLLRTLLISVPLIAANMVILLLWNSQSSTLYVSSVLCTLLLSAWIGCRTASGSAISVENAFLSTGAAVTGLATGYLLHTISDMGYPSWGVLDELNRYLYSIWWGWSSWIVPLEILIISATCGSIVRRMNRKYHRTMLVMILFSWVALFRFSAFSYWHKIAMDSIAHPYFRSYLGTYLARFLSAIVGTWLGGLWRAPKETASPSVTNADDPLTTY